MTPYMAVFFYIVLVSERSRHVFRVSDTGC